MFNLSWFKTKKKEEELLDLQIKKEKMVIDSLEKGNRNLEDLERKWNSEPLTTAKPYKKIKFVNDILTVVFNDGSVINKPQSAVDDFYHVRLCASEADIIAVMETDVKETPKTQEVSDDNLSNVINFHDFETKDGCIYIKGVDRSLPPLLVNKFAEIINHYTNEGSEEAVYEDDEYISLKRFFLWCCLNPRAEVADKLYDFLVKNDFKITKQGFFVALRNVVKLDEADHKLVDVISNAYNKVKAVWKKTPSQFRIEENDGEYSMHKVTTDPKGSIIGNLETLYLDLPNMRQNRYTDNYTHTFDIRIGKKVSMPPEECSWSTADCAEAGLHFAGHTAPYVLCGDTTVFTLHNPMKVVGIGQEKGRCWEYLPFMTSSVSEAEEIMMSEDFDFLELNEQYAVDELKDLEDKVKNGFAAEAKKYEFNFPNISSSQVRNIINILDEMKDKIKNRVNFIQ